MVQQMHELRTAHEGPPPVGQLGEGLHDQFEGDTEEDEDEADGDPDAGNDERSDDFMQDGEDMG